MSRKRTIPRVCEQCGETFLAAPDRIRAGGGRFCSRACGGKSQIDRVSITCHRCGITVEMPRNRQRAMFCSQTCQFSPVAPTIHEDGTATIPIYAQDGSIRGLIVIDADDADWAAQWLWYLNDQGYAVRRRTPDERLALGGVGSVRMHRELLGLKHGDGIEGDHENRNRLDNRRSNLRPVPGYGNRQNVPGIPTATSKFRGVSWDRRYGKWAASVKANGKRYHCGYFSDEVAAAASARLGRQRLLPYSID